MATHKLTSGESLVSVATDNGFLHWKTIFDHPSNAALKSKRQHPNALRTGDEVNIPDKEVKPISVPTGAVKKLKVAIGRGVWKLHFSAAHTHCGEKLKITGETNLPDGDLKLAVRSHQPESPKLTPVTVKLAGGKFELDWEVKNVHHHKGGTPGEGVAEVAVEATTENNAVACNVAVVKVEAVPKAAAQTFDASHTWNGYSNHAHFEQSIDNFINKVEVKVKALKAWSGTYVDLSAFGVAGTAGGCPWDGHRWARGNGLSMTPTQYYDGANWVPLPAGFAGAAANYHTAGFYKSGATFVCTSGGGATWPGGFADYDFNAARYVAARTRWSQEAHTVWSDKFRIRRKGCKSDKTVVCCSYGVDLALSFTEVAAHAADVTLLAPGNNRSNSGLWHMDSNSNNMPAHETGHHVDNPDEYAGGGFDSTLNGDGAVNGICDDCIMGRNKTQVKKRHYHAFVAMTAKLVNGVTGRHEQFEAVDK